MLSSPSPCDKVNGHRCVIVFAAFGALLTLCLRSYGRGESWMPKPPAAPSVATLTNEARYVEWKFREDVTDPTTGLDTKRLKAKVEALRQKLSPKENVRVVKARMSARLPITSWTS